MGVDVNLYAEGPVTDERLAEAEDYLREHLGDASDSGQWLSRSDAYDAPRVEFYTLSRYYGPYYERGDWPTIYGYIRAMRTALPECTVYYTGDSSDDGPEADDEYLDEIWAWWLGPHGQDYRK